MGFASVIFIFFVVKYMVPACGEKESRPRAAGVNPLVNWLRWCLLLESGRPPVVLAYKYYCVD